MERISIPAVMEQFEAMNSFVKSQAEQAGFDSDTLNRILLAAEEVFVNIASYAYGGGSGTVDITCGIDQTGCFSAEFSDSGTAFDPLARENPNVAAPAADRQVGGLGIFLVKQVMDSVRYSRIDGRNVLTMTKHLPSSEQAK